MRLAAGMAAGMAACLAVPGCNSPVEPAGEAELADAIIGSVRRELRDAEQHPAARLLAREDRTPELGIDPRFMDELLSKAGPSSYASATPTLGDDLLNRATRTAEIDLRRAIASALDHNLELRFARVTPALRRAQIVEAEAAFDWTFFTNTEYSALDQPRTRQAVGTTTFGVGADVRKTTSLTSGLRRRLTTGGQLTLQQQLSITDASTPGLFTSPDPADEVAWTIQLDQPLLRGFGSEFSLSEIRLERNAERDAIAALHASTIELVTNVEQAYWELVRSHRDVLILQRLLDRGLDTRDKVRVRFDVGTATQAQLADANARVEQRRGLVLRGYRGLQSASDRLKLLIDDPDLSLGSDIQLIPADDLIDEPIAFSLKDSLLTALESRPEIRQAVLSLDNTAIRAQQARNNLLPRLDMRLQARVAGLDDDFRAAYADTVNGQFVDYLVQLNFEVPIGNRAAESLERRRRMEQVQATTAYQNAIKQVTAEVLNALRDVVVSYELISQARTTRLAESENLRAFEVEERLVQDYTVERLAEKLRREDALANAERSEIQAMSDYCSSLASFYAAMGTALERNGVRFVVPEDGRATAP